MARFRWTMGRALILGGWALLLVGVALEASIALAGGFLPPRANSENLARLLFVPWALGFIFAGYALDHPEVLWGRGNGARVAATYLLFADGAIHTLAIGEHIDLPVVAFFVALAPLEWLGAFYLLHGSARYLESWMFGSVGLILLYLAARLTTLPLVTQELYIVEPLGLMSKTVEILLTVALARTLWVERLEAKRIAARRPATQS